MVSLALSKLLLWKNGSQLNQFLMAVILTVPTLNFGMFLGWVSPMTPLLQSDAGPLSEPLSDDVVTWMASVTFVTSLPLVFVMGYLGDRFGRKFAIQLTSLSLIICWLIKLVYLRPWSLIVARAIAGIAVGGCYVVTPLYLKEISDDNIRGALGSLLILSQNLGYLIVYLCGDLLSFNANIWICLAIPTAHFLLTFATPETPVFLIKLGKSEEAQSVLAWLRSVNPSDKGVVADIHKLEMEEREAKTSKKTSLVTIVSDKTTFHAFRIALAVMLSQECCGYMVVLMFASEVFGRAAGEGDGKGVLSPNKQAVILGAVQLVGSLIASCVVEKIGRKRLLAGASFTMGACMVALGASFYAAEWKVGLAGEAEGVGAAILAWLPAVAACGAILADAAGYQPVPYVIMAELFSFQLRGMVSSFVIMCCVLADFVQIKTFGPIAKLIGLHYTFWAFALLCFLGTIYTILCVPETRGKSLDDIYEVLRTGETKEKRKDEEENVQDSRF